MKTILVVLQNAWRETGAPFTHKQWLNALWESHTGRRLKNMLPTIPHYLYVTNASTNIGITSSAAFPADTQHIQKEIATIQPDIIIACGKIAQQGVKQITENYIATPHPAWRAFSKQHEEVVRSMVEAELLA